jgi:hypothetical protein
MERKPAYFVDLPSGRTIGQRQLLCALTLHQLEHVARAIAKDDAALVGALMADVLELICEVRRTLDRELGSNVAQRRARKRHERTYLVRARAIELFVAAGTGSVLSRSRHIYEDVSRFSKELGAPLTSTRGPTTVYNWLRTYQRNTTPAAQA